MFVSKNPLCNKLYCLIIFPKYLLSQFYRNSSTTNIVILLTSSWSNGLAKATKNLFVTRRFTWHFTFFCRIGVKLSDFRQKLNSNHFGLIRTTYISELFRIIINLNLTFNFSILAEHIFQKNDPNKIHLFYFYVSRYVVNITLMRWALTNVISR